MTNDRLNVLAQDAGYRPYTCVLRIHRLSDDKKMGVTCKKSCRKTRPPGSLKLSLNADLNQTHFSGIF